MKESPLLGDGFWHGFFDKGIIKEFNLPAPYEKLLKCFKKRDIYLKWHEMYHKKNNTNKLWFDIILIVIQNNEKFQQEKSK